MKVKKIKSRKILINVGWAILFCALGWYLRGRFMPDFAAMMPANETPAVVVSALTKKDIAARKKFIAQTEAINSVDLMPQVSGYLEEILFKDGAYIQENEPVFIIEQRRYKADLKAAEAAVKQLKREYERIVKLHKTGDVADKQRDMAESALEQAEAALDQARLNLEHTRIVSPISGYIGKALVTKGNLVSPNAQKLARIVQTNPIRIAFSVTDKERAAFMKKTRESQEILVDVVLPDGNIKTISADKLFADNEVNPATATLPVYLDLENEDHVLVPGNYVDIYFRFDMGKQSLLVPQMALSADVNGTYVMTVNADNIAEQKYITLGDVIDDKQVVLSGLADTDKVIVQGLQKVRNGGKVKPTVLPVQP